MEPRVPQNVTVKSEDIEIVPHSKVNAVSAELQLVARGQTTALDPNTINESSVCTSQILNHELTLLPHNLGMVSRNLRIWNHHVHITSTTEQEALINHFDGRPHRPVRVDVSHLSDNMDAPCGAKQLVHIDSGLCGQNMLLGEELPRPTRSRPIGE